MNKLTDKKIPFSEYPRPQLKRKSFLNLNGQWLLNGLPITIPFPPESELSGYGKKVKIGEELVYEKEFSLPEDFEKHRKNGGKILLNFGAVDQTASVYIDGKSAGFHEGGYLPFSFDITNLLSDKEDHLIRVEVLDNLCNIDPYGKQCAKSHGMWYTKVSGIWQTVWMECVGFSYITSIKINPSTDRIELSTTTSESTTQQEGLYLVAKIPSKNGQILEKQFEPNQTVTFDFSNESFFKEWSPESPNLYDFTVELCNKDAVIDKIESYFALRTIKTEVSEDGYPQILLNDKPIFLNAVLDQGYFPEGIFLPEGEDKWIADIKNLQSLGFNTIRKHIKIESEVFYYYCDKYGMLVMQDMVQNGKYRFLRDTALPSILGKTGKLKSFFSSRETSQRKMKQHRFFIEHTKNTIAHLYNHPSIIYWTIFNEGWGQFSTNSLYDLVCSLDSSRIIDSASGWFKGSLKASYKSDVESDHIYFKTPDISKLVKECIQKRKALIISECGGYTLAVKNHCSQKKCRYGYGNCRNDDELTEKIHFLYEKMIKPHINKGLSGCVYTQLNDVENEINGIYTYDRKVCKLNKKIVLL